MAFQRRGPRAAQQEREHRAHFARRSASNVKKVQQLFGRPALEPFRDVVRNRKDGALELIAKGEAEARWRVRQKFVAPIKKVRPLSATPEDLQSVGGHGREEVGEGRI